jgi:hypothetical protein
MSFFAENCDHYIDPANNEICHKKLFNKTFNAVMLVCLFLFLFYFSATALGMKCFLQLSFKLGNFEPMYIGYRRQAFIFPVGTKIRFKVHLYNPTKRINLISVGLSNYPINNLASDSNW